MRPARSGYRSSPQSGLWPGTTGRRPRRRDGGWGYHFGDPISTSSMTCAGVSSLVITGSRRFQGAEYLQGALIHNCGQGAASPNLRDAPSTGSRATSPSARTSRWASSGSSIFSTGWSGPAGSRGFASSASTTGIAWGPKSWSTPGPAVRLLERRHAATRRGHQLCTLVPGQGPRTGAGQQAPPWPRGDWNHDPDDVRNLVAVVSRDWKNLLTWQIVDPAVASVADLLQAPIVSSTATRCPEFNALAKQNLRDYVEQGGFCSPMPAAPAPNSTRGSSNS